MNFTIDDISNSNYQLRLKAKSTRHIADDQVDKPE
jgi:hypothetical protein